ncbi:MAG: hypothetical protein HKO08_13205 [Erythrobacter sp.]|nr:hypothetical protein [Erythrobacter sp.]
MSITREEIAAFADGQLPPEREAEVAAAVASDPTLAEEVAKHRALKAMLQGHFAPIAEEPVPENLAALLRPEPQSEVVDFAAAREKREQKRKLPSWGWVAGPALAASLAIAIFLPRGNETTDSYADAQLASVLEQTLVAEQLASADTRILLSFQNDDAEFCRAFSAADGGGIACRDDNGWKFEALGEGSETAGTEYRMAGAGDADILAIAQELAEGPALDAEAERAAREAGWR